MAFARYKKDGSIIRYKHGGLDCQAAIEAGEPVLTEQSHKDEVDINKIIKRHGMDLIRKTAMLQSQDFQFDDVSGNDFQEAMQIITKAQQTFDNMPSALRQQFNNSPAEYLDFVQNPENNDRMVEMGLAQRTPIPEPIQVIVTNPEPIAEPNPETP